MRRCNMPSHVLHVNPRARRLPSLVYRPDTYTRHNACAITKRLATRTVCAPQCTVLNIQDTRCANCTPLAHTATCQHHMLHLAPLPFPAPQERNVRQLSTQVSDAQRELAAVRDMCKQAAQRLEQSMWVRGGIQRNAWLPATATS